MRLEGENKEGQVVLRKLGYEAKDQDFIQLQHLSVIADI